MKARTILLVEDNPQDELLILRSLRKINLANHGVQKPWPEWVFAGWPPMNLHLPGKDNG